MKTVDMLRRATAILEGQAGASLAQMSGVSNLAQAFEAMVKASMISTGDAAKLTAFVQDSDKNEDEALGAPAAAVYTSQSGNIIDILQDLTEKAETQLADLTQKEVNNKQNYELLKQSLEDEISNQNKELSDARKGAADASERKATA